MTSLPPEMVQWSTKITVVIRYRVRGYEHLDLGFGFYRADPVPLVDARHPSITALTAVERFEFRRVFPAGVSRSDAEVRQEPRRASHVRRKYMLLFEVLHQHAKIVAPWGLVSWRGDERLQRLLRALLRMEADDVGKLGSLVAHALGSRQVAFGLLEQCFDRVLGMLTPQRAPSLPARRSQSRGRALS